ncbi:hypothetical protein GYMLUDRAFT_50403 [Collybiopsis luxurians FD-317 M1]|uniref:Unplaced genomic scaffold GYMLUscaffold_110, whole genome shotgun sequence n=1 Tax=Collybiopsis luxurians FD-317 M1 TaxID=944289 RepID=A0A0D0C1M9_9AGAR|nr:hypothetical protein GYMLUDRAFT_50403 [Collybiopsis luxurians FD-317 M1]
MDPSQPSSDLAQSPFKSVIGTNYSPSTAEAAIIKSLLVEPQRERARLESEMRRIQALLEKTKEYIEAHQSLISPIRQLPSETLAEIFLWCLPADALPVRNVKQAPLLFTTICRAWRVVALSTPRLWSSLHIYLPQHLTIDELFQRRAGISRWLERSGSLPLFISLHGRTSLVSTPTEFRIAGSSVKDNMMYLIRLLMEFGDRIMDLSLSLSPRDFLLFDELSPPQFPALISLSIRDANLHEGSYGHLHENDPREMSLTSLLQRMPRLQKLQLKDFSNHTISAHTLGVRSLTSLDLSGASAPFAVTINIVQALDLLSQTPWLQFLKMSIMLRLSGTDQVSPLPNVHLEHLEELRIGFSTSTVRPRTDAQARMISLFTRIQCPSLKKLSVTWQGWLISEIPFRGLPLCSLEFLELHLLMEAEVLFECLALLTNVKTLQLRTGKYRSEFGNNNTCALQNTHLLAMTLSAENTTPLCPRLENFHFVDKLGRGLEALSTAALTNFIASRKGTLQYCDLFFTKVPGFTEGELDCLRELKQEGMKIRIHGAKSYPVMKLDAPDVGMVPWRQHRAVRPSFSISDMEGANGTDVII